MKTHYTNVFVLILLSGILTACGFHLRGEQDLSALLPEVKIQGVDKYSELGRDLTQALIAAKVNVTDESSFILEITNETLSKRVLSIDAAGRANQYELNYQLGFKLVKMIKENETSRKEDVLPKQTVSAKREYLFDSNLVLAKADEENQLKKDMRQTVMLQLTRRLMYSLKALQPETLESE